MMSIIQEYSNHLEEIFENSFEYMYLHDKKGNILDVNNIVVQNLGYSKNEILNMKVTDFLLEEVPSIISDEIKKTMETGVANKSRTYKVRKKDSTFIYVEVSAVPLKKNGEFYAILGIGHDVTAYKEVEQNLRESEEKFRRIFETIPDLFFLVSSDTTILDYKGNVKDFFVPPEKLINRKISEIVPEDIATISSNSIKKTIESHEPQIVEYELLIKGINRIFEARHLYFSQDRVLVFIREITKRKRSEQKLKEKNLELSVLNRIITLGNESTSLQEFLEKSYDQVLDIVSFDRGGVYLYNPETQHNNLVVHKNVHHDFIAAVEDVDISEGLFAKVFDKNKPFYIEDFSDFMEGSKELGIYSTAIIPLRSKDKYVGSMNIGSPVYQILSRNELELLVAISKQMGIIIQKFESEKLLKESEEKFRKLSYELEEMVNERTKELKQSEEKYRELFNGMSNGVAVYETLDEGNTFIFKDMNPSGEKISGVKRNDIIGNDVLDLFPKVKTTGLIDTFKTVYKSNTPIRHPIAFYGDETISLWAENYVYKLPTGEIVAVYDDLTVLKITEQKLKKLNEELEQKVDERTKELKESEEKFRIITEQSFIGVIIEQDFDIKYVNQQFSTIIGYSTEELLNWKLTDFYDIFHPDDLDKFKEIVDKKAKDIIQDITTFQLRLFKKTGEIIWLELSSKAIIYQDKPANLAFIMDITEKKEADQKIKESEEKFRNITEQSLVGIVILQDDVFKYANKRVANIIGYTIEEIQNWGPREFAEVIHPEYQQVALEQARKKQNGSKDVITNYIIKCIKKTGEYIWVEIFSRTISYQGRLADFIVFIDITEQKNSEQKLKESEEKFRNITEQSFMGIIIIQAGEFKYINKAMANIAGYPVEEMLNWSEKDMIKLIYQEDLEIVLNRLQSNIEGKMGPFSSNSFRMINRNGEVRWLADYTTRILYEGKLANLISIIDITDKKEAEQLITEENKRLIELYELRKDLITRVSHELKTPMTSIYGAHQILIKLYMEEIGEEAQKYIEIGHRGSLRLKQLIDNLLDVSRLDSKKFELRLQKENLVELIVDCVKDMNYLAFNRQLKMKLELPNEVYLDIDRLRFRQVLTNIISNAIKNTPSGGEIHINLIEKADNLDIHIIDTGVGLIEKEMEKLFEKFGKIERYGMDLGVDIEGSGLGLFISKEIMELHGGQILVESEGRNKGSTFTIRLNKT